MRPGNPAKPREVQQETIMIDTANSFSRNLLGAFAALVLGTTFVGAATGPAHAATVTAAPSQVVFYGDLNLASAAGRAAYDARIRGAAKAVCATGLDSVAARSAEAQCVNAAVASAKPATKA
jgi:UrcA family protein